MGQNKPVRHETKQKSSNFKVVKEEKEFKFNLDTIIELTFKLICIIIGMDLSKCQLAYYMPKSQMTQKV